MLTGIPFVDAHGALRPGQLVEVCGVGGSGKTEILMQAAVCGVMPRERRGVRFGGCESGVLLLDLDGKFDTQIKNLPRIRRHMFVAVDPAAGPGRTQIPVVGPALGHRTPRGQIGTRSGAGVLGLDWGQGGKKDQKAGDQKKRRSEKRARHVQVFPVQIFIPTMVPSKTRSPLTYPWALNLARRLRRAIISPTISSSLPGSTIPKSTVWGLAWHPQGHLLCSGANGSALRLLVEGGEALRLLPPSLRLALALIERFTVALTGQQILHHAVDRLSTERE